MTPNPGAITRSRGVDPRLAPDRQQVDVLVAAISIQVPASPTFQFDVPADHGFELGQIVVEYVKTEFSKRPGVERVVDEGCGAIEQQRRPMLVQRGGYRQVGEPPTVSDSAFLPSTIGSSSTT